ncbi:hypothetical protein CPC08DRAFT_647741, partial [Agrocybe pediades]
KMVNPGTFQGSRKEFLLAQASAYAKGMEDGTVSDVVADIQRRYFKRYPIELPHEEEPSPEALAAVNDDSPDPEIPEPCLETLGEEAYAAELERLNKRQKDIKARKDQIKRCLHYQYTRAQEKGSKDGGASAGSVDPYRIMMHRLCGTEAQKPRRLSAANTWRKLNDNAKLIEKERKKLIAINDEVARDLFGKLPKEEQDSWLEVAKDNHERKMVEWKKLVDQDPSEDPADRQRSIQNLVQFAQPVLDVICKATGWKATLIAGGPEPADEGRLNVISIHSGTTTGDHKMNFGHAERTRYKKLIVPIFGNFLLKCYSQEECLARALPVDNELQALMDMHLEEEGADFDAGSWSSPLPEAQPSVKRTTSSPDAEAPAASAPALPATATSTTTSSRAKTARQNTSSHPPLHDHSSGERPDCLDDIDTPPPPSPAPSSVARSSPLQSPPPSPSHGRSPTPFAFQENPQPSVPSKRPASTTEGSNPDVHADAPSWFKKALQMIDTDTLGLEWVGLINVWSNFEARHFNSVEKHANLPAKNRPRAVRDWIQRARVPNWRPVIKNLDNFKNDVLGWWSFLQGADASGVPRPGVNGNLSLLAALFFWGEEMAKTGGTVEQKAKWTELVKDLTGFML